MMRVLISGATGYLGGFVAKEFKRRGYWVRVLARNTKKLERIKNFYDEKYIGEVTNPDSIKDVCRNIDIVFSSIGITRQRDNLTYWDVDYQGNRNLLNAALASKVSKFIYVSVLNGEKMEHLKIIEAKQAFVRDLQQSGINHTVIYPNGFFSDMIELFEMAKRGRGYFFGKGYFKGNPIHGEDLAEICVDAAESGEEKIAIGGPDVMTHREMYELACQALRKDVKTTNIPLWIRDLILMLARTFTSSKTYGPLEFFMTVMSMDMIAEPKGKHHLKDFFIECSNKR